MLSRTFFTRFAPQESRHDDPQIAPFLFNTNGMHNLMKTKEKRVSIQYKFGSCGTASPAAEGDFACPERTRRACALRFWNAAISRSFFLAGRIFYTTLRKSPKQKINRKPAGDQHQPRQSRRSAIAQQHDQNYAGAQDVKRR